MSAQKVLPRSSYDVDDSDSETGKKDSPEKNAVVKTYGIKLADLPPDAQASLKHLDIYGDGNIDVMDILSLNNKEENAKSNVKFMKSLLIVVFFAWFLTMGVIAGMTVAVVNLTKESHVSSDGVMVTTDQTTAVQTASTDFYVDSNGVLTTRNDNPSSIGRRLQSSDEQGTVVQTQVKMTQHTITSADDDSTLNNLDSITLFPVIYSEEESFKSSGLTLNVFGFVRLSDTIVVFLSEFGPVYMGRELIFVVIDHNSQIFKNLTDLGYPIYTSDSLPSDLNTSRRLSGTSQGRTIATSSSKK